MIYLDNNATTQPSESVVEAMVECLRSNHSNPSSATADFTGSNMPRMKAARAMVKLLGAEGPETIYFTSGATEANNWAFHSTLKTLPKARIAVFALEHPSVADPAEALRDAGHSVDVIPSTLQGTICLDSLRETLAAGVDFLSVMAVNNEIGTIQPIAQIGEMLRELAPSAVFHCDATQAVGKVSIDLMGDYQNVDILTFSGHKFHGPKGIGGLYARPGTALNPMILGGGQEGGMRSGTENTSALAGLAQAALEAVNASAGHVRLLRDEFESWLCSLFPESVVFGAEAPRVDNTSCFSIARANGPNLVEMLAQRGIILGTGSSCSSSAMAPPKTLLAMGVAYDLAESSIRVSLSRYTTPEQMNALRGALEFSEPHLASHGINEH